LTKSQQTEQIINVEKMAAVVRDVEAAIADVRGATAESALADLAYARLLKLKSGGAIHSLERTCGRDGVRSLG
jgi:hypothetical protein